MAANASGPAEKMEAITKGSPFANGTGCRGILCGTPGTANITVGGVALVNVPIQQGYNPIRVQSVQTGGTADNMWALY